MSRTAYVATSSPVAGRVYELWTLSFDLPAVAAALTAQTGPQLVEGYEQTASMPVPAS